MVSQAGAWTRLQLTGRRNTQGFDSSSAALSQVCQQTARSTRRERPRSFASTGAQASTFFACFARAALCLRRAKTARDARQAAHSIPPEPEQRRESSLPEGARRAGAPDAAPPELPARSTSELSDARSSARTARPIRATPLQLRGPPRFRLDRARRPPASAKRHRGDSNPCGQSPMDFESISLAARTQCLGCSLLRVCLRKFYKVSRASARESRAVSRQAGKRGREQVSSRARGRASKLASERRSKRATA